MKIHMVKKGDSLYNIAQKYGVTLEELLQANPNIANPDVIDVGMKIKIPMPAKPAFEIMHQHTVQQGDTLWKLSKAWGVPLETMIKANPQLKNPNVLLTGEVVNVPKLASAGENGTGVVATPVPAPSAGDAQGGWWPGGKANTGVMPGTGATVPGTGDKKGTGVMPMPVPIAPAPEVPVAPAPAPAPVLPAPVSYPVPQPVYQEAHHHHKQAPVHAEYGSVDLFKQYPIPPVEAIAPIAMEPNQELEAADYGKGHDYSSYGHESYGHGGYGNEGYGHVGHGQVGYGHEGYGHEGYGHESYGQAGYGNASYGHDSHGHGYGQGAGVGGYGGYGGHGDFGLGQDHGYAPIHGIGAVPLSFPTESFAGTYASTHGHGWTGSQEIMPYSGYFPGNNTPLVSPASVAGAHTYQSAPVVSPASVSPNSFAPISYQPCDPCTGATPQWPGAGSSISPANIASYSNPGVSYPGAFAPNAVSPANIAPQTFPTTSHYGVPGISPAAAYPGAQAMPFQAVSPASVSPFAATPLTDNAPNYPGAYPYVGGVSDFGPIPPIPSFPAIPPMGSPIPPIGTIGSINDCRDEEQAAVPEVKLSSNARGSEPAKKPAAKAKAKTKSAPRQSAPKRKQSLPWVNW